MDGGGTAYLPSGVFWCRPSSLVTAMVSLTKRKALNLRKCSYGGGPTTAWGYPLQTRENLPYKRPRCQPRDVGHGKLPGSSRTGCRFDGDSTVTAKPSSLSVRAVGEGVDVLPARTQEIQKVDANVLTGLNVLVSVFNSYWQHLYRNSWDAASGRCCCRVWHTVTQCQ